MERYPFYAARPAGAWRNAVRTSLVDKNIFVRCPTASGKGGFWGLLEDHRDDGPELAPDAQRRASKRPRVASAQDGGKFAATTDTESEEVKKGHGRSRRHNTTCTVRGCTSTGEMVACTTCILGA